MAEKTIVTVISDISGEEDASHVFFGWGTNDYAIDLTDAESAQLEDVLAPYIQKARKVASQSRRAPRQMPRRNIQQVRNWAKEHGHAISDRGRIPVAVQAAFDAAH